MKIWFNLVGCIAVILAILGIFLPLLPTTPFLLLASACFARGSRRLHARLLGNRVFGEYLRNFEEGRGIPLRGKVVALLLMWASMVYAANKVASIPLKIMLMMIAIGVTVYLVRFVPLWRPRPAETAPAVTPGGAADIPP